MKKGLVYSLSKLCFFDDSGDLKRMDYRVVRGNESMLDCTLCHFQERCQKLENSTLMRKEKENDFKRTSTQK